MKILSFLLGVLLLQSCKTALTGDLSITHANVFDARKGIVLENRIILINADTIVGVFDSGETVNTKRTINAGGKLVTPGIIDAHVHPQHVFGDDEAAPSRLSVDSLVFYRKKFTDTYFPYGVTTVMIMGQPEAWLKPVLNWSTNSSPDHTNIYTTGGVLISDEERKPYIGHIEVNSPGAAKQKILDYYNLGVRHIKLYKRLRRPEFEAAFKTADSLNMKIYGHIDPYDGGAMTIDTALKIGLQNFEHLFTIATSVFDDKDNEAFVASLNQYYKGNFQSLSFFEIILEAIHYMVINHPEKFDALLIKLKNHNAGFSTTIHLFAEKFGLSYFSNPNNKPDSNWSKERIARNAAVFKSFMILVKKVYDQGIPIRIGTDCPDGGKAAVSEQLLLAEYGFTIPAIIQLSTINGAIALGMENKYGSIEKGKKADLIIYEQSPFDDYKNFLSKKTIIKDGIIYTGALIR